MIIDSVCPEPRPFSPLLTPPLSCSQVRVLYAASPPTAPVTAAEGATSALQPPAAAPAAGSAGGGTPLLGRRMVLPVNFRIHPTLSPTAVSFLEHFAPLRDGARVTVPRLVPPATAGGSGGGGSGPGGNTRGLLGGPASGMAGRERSEPVLFGHGGLVSDVEGGLGGAGALSSRIAGLDLMTSRLKESQRVRTVSLCWWEGEMAGRLLTAACMAHASCPFDCTLLRVCSCPGCKVCALLVPRRHTNTCSRRTFTCHTLSSTHTIRILDHHCLRALSQARTRSFELDLEAEGLLDAVVSAGGADPAADRDSFLAANSSGLIGPGSASGALSAAPLSPGLRSMSQAVMDHGGSLLEHQVSSTVGWGEGGRPPVAVAGGEKLRLVCDCVVAVVVTNRSDRYFRVWLGRVADSACPGVESSQEVVAPGGSARLLACLQGAHLPAPAQQQEPPESGIAAGAGGGAGAGEVTPYGSGTGSGPALLPCASIARRSQTTGALVPAAAGTGVCAGSGSGGGGWAGLAEEADRMAAAELLSDGWAVCWRLITAAEGGEAGAGGAGAASVAPTGVVRLAAVDVARVGDSHRNRKRFMGCFAWMLHDVRSCNECSC